MPVLWSWFETFSRKDPLMTTAETFERQKILCISRGTFGASAKNFRRESLKVVSCQL